ncbi:MAG: cobalamin biosynthesis protein [Pseudomonadota bacterium]
MIVAGFGFRAGATAESLADALRAASGGRPVAALATPADKVEARAFAALAAALRLPARAVAPAALVGQDTATRSSASHRARGVGSVAEAAALAAAGPGARLLAPRAVSRDRQATCALAEGGDP